MDFSNVIGQSELCERLRGVADSGRMPHAIMLCGPDGAGKLAIAIALATYILDKGRYAVHGTEHPDLHFSFPTIKLAKWASGYKPVSADFIADWHTLVASTGAYFDLAAWLTAMKADKQQPVITVGESAALCERLMIKSSQGGWKISIIWLPELMNGEAANKMLKMIEEPPAQTLFILVSREPERLLDTIRSRVQRYDVKPIADDDMRQALITRRMLETDEAERVTRLAHGNWLTATAELDVASENHRFFDFFTFLMRHAWQRNLSELKRWAERAAALGRAEQRRMLTYFLRMTREAFVYNFHRPELSYMTREEEQFCQKFARFIHERNVLGFQDVFQAAGRDIGQNANAKIVFFDITMRVAVLLHTT